MNSGHTQDHEGGFLQHDVKEIKADRYLQPDVKEIKADRYPTRCKGEIKADRYPLRQVRGYE